MRHINKAIIVGLFISGAAFAQTNAVFFDGSQYSSSGGTTSLTTITTLPGGLDVAYINVANNLTLDRQSCFITNVSGTVYFETEKIGGGDIRILFTNIVATLDCTTGAGVGGRARVPLSVGTDTVPQENFIYVTNNGSTAYITNSTDHPTGDFSALARVVLQSAGTTLTNGPLTMQRFSDDVQRTSGRGRVDYISERIRELGATWDSGASCSVTDDAGGNLTVSVSSGVVYQMHRQTFDAFSDPATMYVVNDPDTPFRAITNLNQITKVANGDNIVIRDYFAVRLIGFAASGDDGQSRLFLQLPDDIYRTQDGALSDASGYDNNTIDHILRGGAFNIARIVVFDAPSGDYQLVATQDKRGEALNATGTGGGSSTAQEFTDSTFRVYDNSDATKKLAFQVSGVTTSTTRTVTVQDTDGTIALTDFTNNWTAEQYFNQSVGIGTNSPATTLDVNGAITATAITGAVYQGTFTTNAPSDGQVAKYNATDARWYAANEAAGSPVPSTNYSFLANWNGVNQAFSATTSTRCNFTNLVWDTGGAYSATNARFYPPINGRYLFHMRIGNSTSGNDTGMMFYRVNGSDHCFEYIAVNAAVPYYGGDITMAIQLTTNDYVEPYLYLNGGSTIAGTTSLTWWAGCLMDED